MFLYAPIIQKLRHPVNQKRRNPNSPGKTRIFRVKIKFWSAELRSCMAKRVPPRGIAHLRPKMKLPDVDTGGGASLPPPVSCVSLRNVLF